MGGSYNEDASGGSGSDAACFSAAGLVRAKPPHIALPAPPPRLREGIEALGTARRAIEHGSTCDSHSWPGVRSEEEEAAPPLTVLALPLTVLPLTVFAITFTEPRAARAARGAWARATR